MTYLKLTSMQKERRTQYANGNIKAKKLAVSNQAEQKALSNKILKESLSANELVFA